MKNFITGLLEDISQDFVNGLGATSGASKSSLIFSDTDASIASGIFDYFAGIGLALSILYFLLEMNRKYALEGGDMTFKSFFAPFLKLLIAIGVISQGGKIVGFILDINNAFVEAATTTWTDAIGKGIGDQIADVLTENIIPVLLTLLGPLGIMGLIGFLLPLLISMLINIVLKLVWAYKALLYKIELVFRVCIAPISLADVYSGQSSAAIRYLKGLLALGIYGAAMCILPTLATAIGASTLIEGFKNVSDVQLMGIWKILEGLLQVTFLGPFAALSACNAVKTAAKEALGA